MTGKQPRSKRLLILLLRSKQPLSFAVLLSLHCFRKNHIRVTFSIMDVGSWPTKCRAAEGKIIWLSCFRR